jgi:simple sugar transport system permease protein
VIYALVALVGFLAWAGAGAPAAVNIISLFAGAVAIAIPLVFGALGGVIGEKAGVVNIAIEAQLLMAAFTAAVVGTLTGSAWAGVVAAMVAGFAVAALLGFFTIKYKVNQVVVGVVINVLVSGFTTFLFQQWLVPNVTTVNDTRAILFPSVAVPLLSEIPIIGPILFNQNVIAYIMYIAVAAVWFALYRTRWGLRLRAVGEHPKAADTMGVKVNGTRWRAILIAGAIVGIGGSYFTLVSSLRFNWEMTNGMGYIALAAVIFGNWNPLRASMAALLFGFAMNLNNALSLLATPVPSQFLLMLPYAVTLLAVAGLVGKSRAPAADGVPYIPE